MTNDLTVDAEDVEAVLAVHELPHDPYTVAAYLGRLDLVAIGREVDHLDDPDTRQGEILAEVEWRLRAVGAVPADRPTVFRHRPAGEGEDWGEDEVP